MANREMSSMRAARGCRHHVLELAGAHSTSPMGLGGISSDSTARGFASLVINGNYSASYAVIQGKASTKWVCLLKGKDRMLGTAVPWAGTCLQPSPPSTALFAT